MAEYNDFLAYIKSDNLDLPTLLGIITTFTKSGGTVVYTDNGDIFSDKDPRCFDIQEFQHIKSISIVNNEDDNLIVIPLDGYKLCLFGNKSGYDADILYNIRPFIRVISSLLCDMVNVNNSFLTNMSHEIRTPLNGVIGYAQLLEQTELTACQKANVRSLTDCSVQLMQIINNILDVSRLNAKMMNINNECFSIVEIEEFIKSIIGPKITQKKQVIKFKTASNVPKYIVTDKQKILQIILNLVSNAHKYSGPFTYINVTFSVDEPRKLYIKISDNGVGIPTGKISQLFQTFSRLHPESTQNGSGLGLVISKKLALLLDGDVTVDSSEGRGSDFTACVTFRDYKEVEDEVDIDGLVLEGIYVIVVDDMVDNRILLTEQLHSWKINPIVVASAKEALSIIRSNRYEISLGLIDICMPETDGASLAKIIKYEYPLIPLIALSSSDSFVPSCDFEAKLDKPINKLQLYERMRTVMSCSSSLYESPSKNNRHDQRILIAEDNQYNSDMIKKMLQNMGYTSIDIAVNGSDAIDKIKITEHPYDILLLELNMPVKDGYQVIEHLVGESIIKPVIIVVTASVITGEMEKCSKLGVTHFVSKPVDYNSLKRVIIQSLM